MEDIKLEDYYQLFEIIRIHAHFKKPAHWLVGRVFANSSGVLGSIPGQVIPKILKMVLDTSLLHTQQYKVRHHGARISLTLSLHVSLSFIAFGRSSGLHPVSSHSCCMYVCSSRSSCFWLAICRGPQEHITYDLVFASPAVSGMSGSSSLYSFRDRW